MENIINSAKKLKVSNLEENFLIWMADQAIFIQTSSLYSKMFCNVVNNFDFKVAKTINLSA